MPSDGENMERAEKLVAIYGEVRNGNEFARRLQADPRCFATSEQIDFLWEVVDAAFDAGMTAERAENDALPY